MGWFNLGGSKAEKLYKKGMNLLRAGREKAAMEMFYEAAELGHPDACYQYGLHFANSWGFENRKICVQRMEEAAEKGHIQAMHWLITNCLDFSSDHFDIVRGNNWLKKAKQLDLPQDNKWVREIMQYADPEGLFEMAEKEPELKKRLSLLELANIKGSARAGLRLGAIYRAGSHAKPPAPDKKQAFTCFKGAAKKNNELARLAALWMAFFESEELDTEPAKVLEWAESQLAADAAAAYFWTLHAPFEKQDRLDGGAWLRAHEWAAEQGLEGERLCCARLCTAGQGMPRDYARAAGHYEKLAGQGSVDALFELAGLYRAGGYGLAQDQERALELYDKAARRKNGKRQRQDAVNEEEETAARGAARYAEMVFLGEGAEADREKGLEYYIKAGRGFADMPSYVLFKAGVKDDKRRAALDVGRAFFNAGLRREALPLLEMSGDHGNGYTSAMPLLAALYQKGIPGFLEPDAGQAGFWYRAWRRGLHPGDMVMLGACPQEAADEVYRRNRRYVHGFFEPVAWTVLESGPDGVLLLSRRGLDYATQWRPREDWPEYYTDLLFTPTEQALLAGPVFSLSREELERYLAPLPEENRHTSATLNARERQAHELRMGAKIDKEGKLTISRYMGEASDKERFGATIREWGDLLTAGEQPWLLSDGAVVKGEYTQSFTLQQTVVRPAVWVKLPQG